jgi:hypothetical protein
VELDPSEAYPEEPRHEEEEVPLGPLEAQGSGRVFGTRAPYACNHRVDEFVPLSSLQDLDVHFRSRSERLAHHGEAAKSEGVGPRDVIINRLEIRGTVNSVSGDELVYRVDTMVFEPGGRFLVHAESGITLIVKDLVIQSASNPGSIEMKSPNAPSKRPKGAQGQRGVDAPDYTYRGGDGGTGRFGLQGEPGLPCPYLYLIGTRCDNAYPLSIIAVGGRGGAGSDGGDGGTGGNGHRGRDGHGDFLNCYRGCTNGTRGGTGGRGGYPHYGASGGYGGTVWIQGPQTFLDRVRAFRINNDGGAGGSRGNPGTGGSGGRGAFAGSSPGVCSSCYDGRSGFVGSPGPVGDVTGGPKGPTGTIRHIPT